MTYSFNKAIQFNNHKSIITVFLIIVIFSFGQVRAEEEKSLSTDGVTLVEIKTNNSSIKVIPWDEPKAMVNIPSEQDQAIINISKMERKDNKIEIEVEAKSGFIQECEIFVPEEINIQANSINGSIYVMGVKGRKKIETFNGNIELMNTVGSASLKTVNGKIFADIHFDGESDFASVTGSIDILAKDNYSVPISINTVSGSVNIALPFDYATDIDIKSISGQIFSELPPDIVQDGRSLRGKLFGGGSPLKVNTVSGTISIKTSKMDFPPNMPPPMPNHPRDQRKPERRIIFSHERGKERVDLPEIKIKKTLDPPIMDGKLDDKSWEDATEITNFVWADGIGTPHKPTEAYLQWDDQNLYIGIRCHESNMNDIKIMNIERDSNKMWDDDNIQLMIDTTPENETHYYHIAINPIGTIYDQEIFNAEIQRRRTIPTQLGMKWSFGGVVDTDLRDSFWTVEISLPFTSFAGKMPNINDVWKFNIHRMEQQREEYTYWSPTFSMPDWPHVPKRFGNIVFSDMKSIENTSNDQETPSEQNLAITKITIEGNNKISNEAIIEALKLKNGDLADVDAISIAKSRLESIGWFQNIGMELIQNDMGVELVVKVTEKEIISPTAINIEGATAFTKDELVDYFNLTPSMTTTQDIAVKCNLISELYKTREYEVATAKCSMESDTLKISIDEGTIDGIEIQGNSKVKTKDIIESLTLKKGMPYKRNDIDSAINNLKYKLPYFNSINWKPKKTDDGLNIVYIEVKEDSLVKSEFDSKLEFNRVHGLQLGTTPKFVSPYWGSKVYFGFSYGFSSEIWNYQFGAEKSFFRENKTTIGVDVHRMTDTNDLEIISDGENFFAETILGEAFRDYYQREGFEASISQELPIATKLSVKYRDDEYGSLPKTNDWSVLNRFYDDESDRSVKHKRDNPEILEGRMKSVIAEATLDTRNNKDSASNGWYNRLSMEYCGESLGGDYDFKIYQADIRSYNRLSRSQLLAFRVKAATTDRALPRLHPKKFYLGGIGTLRGYTYKEFEGDTIFLMNAEYWLTMGSLDRSGIGIFLFVDSGYAWEYDSEMTASDLKTDIGIGFSFPGSLTVAIATPIEEGEREPVVSLRLNRTF